MHPFYRKDELVKLISKTERHLLETRDDIFGYCYEIRWAQKNNNAEYAADCLNWIKVLLNTYRHLIDEYNDYQSKLSYSLY